MVEINDALTPSPATTLFEERETKEDFRTVTVGTETIGVGDINHDGFFDGVEIAQSAKAYDVEASDIDAELKGLKGPLGRGVMSQTEVNEVYRDLVKTARSGDPDAVEAALKDRSQGQLNQLARTADGRKALKVYANILQDKDPTGRNFIISADEQAQLNKVFSALALTSFEMKEPDQAQAYLQQVKPTSWWGRFFDWITFSSADKHVPMGLHWMLDSGNKDVRKLGTSILDAIQKDGDISQDVINSMLGRVRKTFRDQVNKEAQIVTVARIAASDPQSPEAQKRAEAALRSVEDKIDAVQDPYHRGQALIPLAVAGGDVRELGEHLLVQRVDGLATDDAVRVFLGYASGEGGKVRAGRFLRDYNDRAGLKLKLEGTTVTPDEQKAIDNVISAITAIEAGEDVWGDDGSGLYGDPAGAYDADVIGLRNRSSRQQTVVRLVQDPNGFEGVADELQANPKWYKQDGNYQDHRAYLIQGLKTGLEEGEQNGVTFDQLKTLYTGVDDGRAVVEEGIVAFIGSDFERYEQFAQSEFATAASLRILAQASGNMPVEKAQDTAELMNQAVKEVKATQAALGNLGNLELDVEEAREKIDVVLNDFYKQFWLSGTLENQQALLQHLDHELSVDLRVEKQLADENVAEGAFQALVDADADKAPVSAQEFSLAYLTADELAKESIVDNAVSALRVEGPGALPQLTAIRQVDSGLANKVLDTLQESLNAPSEDGEEATDNTAFLQAVDQLREGWNAPAKGEVLEIPNEIVRDLRVDDQYGDKTEAEPD